MLFPLILGCDMNEQVHVWVDCTVVVKITRSVEWSDSLCVIPIEVNGTDLRSIWLRRLLYFPTRIVEAVCDHVRICHGIDKIERCPFLNCYVRSYKLRCSHERFWIFGKQAC